MRIFAWIGGLAVTVVAGASVVSALGSDPHSTRPVPVSQVQANQVGFGLPLPQGLFPPTPTQTKPSAPAGPSHSAPPASRPVSRPAVVVRSTQQALINQDRARYHLAPLTWNSCLYNVAHYEAAHLAAPGVAFQHYDGVSRDLGCRLGGQVGENIGWYSGGINDSKLNTMFMNSPGHKANILGPYQYVATAWVVRPDGRAFIAVEFS